MSKNFLKELNSWRSKEISSNPENEINIQQAYHKILNCYIANNPDAKISIYHSSVMINPELASKLDLSNLKLSSFPNILRYLSNLKLLDLSLNNLTKFDQKLHYNLSLTEILLHCNKLTEVPDLTKLVSLKKLNFFGNSIEELNCVNLPNGLEHLNFSSNKISKVANLEKLSKLRDLYLSRNQIKIFPFENLNSLTSLSSLVLESNKIKNIDQDLSLPNLEFLNLASNDIDNFPDLKSCPNLSHLIISHNKISDLPEDITALEKLETLEMFECPLKHPEKTSAFQNIKKFYFTGYDTIGFTPPISGSSASHHSYIENLLSSIDDGQRTQLPSPMSSVHSAYASVHLADASRVVPNKNASGGRGMG